MVKIANLNKNYKTRICVKEKIWKHSFQEPSFYLERNP